MWSLGETGSRVHEDLTLLCSFCNFLWIYDYFKITHSFKAPRGKSYITCTGKGRNWFMQEHGWTSKSSWQATSANPKSPDCMIPFIWHSRIGKIIHGGKKQIRTSWDSTGIQWEEFIAKKVTGELCGWHFSVLIVVVVIQIRICIYLISSNCTLNMGAFYSTGNYTAQKLISKEKGQAWTKWPCRLVWISSPPCTSCVMLHKVLNLSVLLFPHV